MAATRLEAGTTAPAFTLQNQAGASVSLADFRGQKVILYFYPEADTPACTTQACDFRDSLGSLTAQGYAVLGVSKDSVDALAAFEQKYGLTFSLLSDPELAVHEKYGTWGEKQNYGKTYLGTLRSTFVIDERGVIEHALYNVKAKGHLAMLSKKLKLQ
jgi:thioredoxin-dependent peroxiredoxin